MIYQQTRLAITSLSQQAYQLIRQQIVSLMLPPGAVIDESLLQTELKLGRTPIREALQRLAYEKLVQIVPRRGIFVTEIGISDLQRLFEVRLELEAVAARLAARRGTPHQMRAMTKLLTVLPTSIAMWPNANLIALDEEFHYGIYGAAHNDFLENTLRTWYTLSLRLWYYFLEDIGDMREALMEHHDILNALTEHDEERAAMLLQNHIQAFQSRIQQAMIGSQQRSASLEPNRP